MKTCQHKKWSAMRYAFAVALALVVAFIAHLPSRSPQPTWRGKSLAAWFDQQVREQFVISERGADSPRPKTAILELAGEAVPFLLQKAQQREPKLAQRYDEAVHALPGWVAQRLPKSNCQTIALERTIALNLLAQILGNGTNSTGGRKDLSPAQAIMITQYLADVWKTNDLESAQS